MPVPADVDGPRGAGVGGGLTRGQVLGSTEHNLQLRVDAHGLRVLREPWGAWGTRLADGIKDGHADAVLAASIFHYGEYTVGEAKRFMADQGISVRM